MEGSAREGNKPPCYNPICIAAKRAHTHGWSYCGFPGGGQGQNPCSNPICVSRNRHYTHVLAVCFEEGGHAWAKDNGKPLVHYTGEERVEKASKANRYCVNPVCVSSRKHKMHTTENCREPNFVVPVSSISGGGGGGGGGVGGGGISGSSSSSEGSRQAVAKTPLRPSLKGGVGSEPRDPLTAANVVFDEVVLVRTPPGGSATAASQQRSPAPSHATAAALPAQRASLAGGGGAASAPTLASSPPPSHYTSLAAVLQIISASHPKLTLAGVRKLVAGLMPRLASQLGTDEALRTDLARMPNFEFKVEGGEEVFVRK
jgi:hypothetical protein